MPLSPVARRVLVALVDAAVPHSSQIPVEPTEPVVRWIEDLLEDIPPLLRAGFPWGLLLLEVLPCVFLGRWSRFSRLDRELRLRYLRGWLGSRFALRRNLVKGYTGLALMGYYGLPEVLNHLGIDHQSYLDRKRAEREQLLGHPIS